MARAEKVTELLHCRARRIMQEVQDRMARAEKVMHESPSQQLNPNAYATYGSVKSSQQSTLRERLQYQVSRAEKQAERALKQKRLIELLDKHPEVAEILDLFEQVAK